MAEIDNTAEELFFKLRNRFPRITMGDENGQVTVNPREGRFFNFDYEHEGEKYGKVTCSLIDPTSLKIYFSQHITEEMDEQVAQQWFGFLRELRRFSKVNMLTFDVRDISKDALNQEDIEFASKQYKGKSGVNESKIHWERRGRFSEGNHKSIKIHVVHKNKMEENPHNRLVQVDKIYLVNDNMERFLLPFTSVTGAKAMANHVARGGTPYDEGGLAIAKAVAEMRNLQRFATATRNKEFESTNPYRVINATRYLKEELRKHLKRMAGGRYFEDSLNAIITLTKADDHRTPEEIKDWFIQKYYNENLDTYLDSAARAYNKYEEHEMSTLREAAASVAQKILDPNYKLVLKADDAMDNLIRSGKYTDKMAMVTRALMDIADRLITKDGDDVANFAAMMSDKISSEGEAFGQRPDEEYKQQKALAIKLAAKYIGDMNKMQADPAYKDEVRKDPTATMGAKKDLYGKAKTAAEAFEDEIMGMGEEDMEEVANRDPKHRFRSLKKAHHKLGEEPNEGNEFSGALAKAKAAGAKTFKVGDKEYQVKEAEEMEAGECNHTAEGQMCPVHGLKECGSGYMEDEVVEAAKPDFLDVDKDGDKEEAMKKALKDKEKKMHENELRRLAGLPVEEVEKDESEADDIYGYDASKENLEMLLRQLDQGRTDLARSLVQSMLDRMKAEPVKEENISEAQQVKFLGYNTTNYPLAKAIADKAYRNGTLVKLSMDANGKPMAIISDPESAGEYEAYWNDQAGAWAIDFD